LQYVVGAFVDTRDENTPFRFGMGNQYAQGDLDTLNKHTMTRELLPRFKWSPGMKPYVLLLEYYDGL
jgi:hypothetical protein